MRPDTDPGPWWRPRPRWRRKARPPSALTPAARVRTAVHDLEQFAGHSVDDAECLASCRGAESFDSSTPGPAMGDPLNARRAASIRAGLDAAGRLRVGSVATTVRENRINHREIAAGLVGHIDVIRAVAVARAPLPPARPPGEVGLCRSGDPPQAPPGATRDTEPANAAMWRARDHRTLSAILCLSFRSLSSPGSGGGV